MSIVALLTDFGWQDPYAGIVKGVLLNTNPALSIIDITHSIPPQDIHTAAFFLGKAAPYFPTNTIFLAVVDPGKRAHRKIIKITASVRHNAASHIVPQPFAGL